MTFLLFIVKNYTDLNDKILEYLIKIHGVIFCNSVKINPFEYNYDVFCFFCQIVLEDYHFSRTITRNTIYFKEGSIKINRDIFSILFEDSIE